MRLRASQHDGGPLEPMGTDGASPRRPRVRRRVRVLIVEDHPAVAAGLATLLGLEEEISIEGVAHSEDEAERLLADIRPDVVVCDVMLGDRDSGFDLLARHRAMTQFLMYSAYDYPAHHARALDGGAAGYLSKVADADRLVAAIRQVARGGRSFPADVLTSARQAPRPPTRRELEVLALVVDGASNDRISEDLGLRVKSVEGILRRLFDRYQVDNRTQLARHALRQGWLTSRPAR